MTIKIPKINLSSDALLIAVFSVLSRAFGLLRDRALASTFGAGSTLDAYYAGFEIPNFIFNTFVLGVLASAFIPIFIRTKNQQGNDSAIELTNTIINIFTTFLLIAATIAIIFAPRLIPIVTPGFDQATTILAIKLTRIMMFSIVIFGLSNILGSYLQANRKFAAFAISPVFYNLGIIVGIYTLVPLFGDVGLGLSVLLGAMAHLAMNTISSLRHGWSWQPKLHLVRDEVVTFFKLIIPRTMGLAASSINSVVTTNFISRLSTGSIAAFNFASNLQSFPINVFGVSLAVAVFPIFSQAFSENSIDSFLDHFVINVRRIIYYVMPLTVLMLVLRAQIVRVLLGSGSFDWSDTIKTAQVLGFLSLAMMSDSLIPLLARAFYALPDTKTPFFASIVSIVTNFTLLILLRHYSLVGVGIAYLGSSLINLTLLLVFLGRRLGRLRSGDIIAGIKPMMLSSLASGLVAYLCLHVMSWVVDMHSGFGILVQGAVAGIVGIVVYLFTTYKFKLMEFELIKEWLDKAVLIVKKVCPRT